MTECQKCGSKNPSDFKFCQECGEVLIELIACPDCGHKNQTDFKFCMNCGYALQPQPPAPRSEPPPVQLQQPSPQPQYQPQPQPAQPPIVIIQEPQQSRRSPFSRLVARFVVSTVVGFVFGKVWQILGETILTIF